MLCTFCKRRIRPSATTYAADDDEANEISRSVAPRITDAEFQIVDLARTVYVEQEEDAAEATMISRQWWTLLTSNLAALHLGARTSSGPARGSRNLASLVRCRRRWRLRSRHVQRSQMESKARQAAHGATGRDGSARASRITKSEQNRRRQEKRTLTDFNEAG